MDELGKPPCEPGQEAKDKAQMALVTTATCLVLAIFADETSRSRTPILSLAAAGLVLPRIRSSWLYWLSCVGVLVVRHFFLWSSLDNHQWLLCYWCLALALATYSGLPAENLRTMATLMIAVCFGFAFLWKISNREFLDGSFFEYQIIGGDRRFDFVATRVLGISEEQVRAIRKSILTLTYQYILPESSAAMPIQAKVSIVAQAITYWTLFIEAAVTFAFAVKSLSRYRVLVLSGFIATTYVFAPVLGFAWLLCTMGLAQCDSLEGRAGRALTLLMILVPSIGLPLKWLTP